MARNCKCPLGAEGGFQPDTEALGFAEFNSANNPRENGSASFPNEASNTSLAQWTPGLKPSEALSRIITISYAQTSDIQIFL